MRLSGKIGTLGTALVAALTLAPATVHACAACYGQSDSPMAQGFNWGIISLLAVVVPVLATIAGFFIYLGKRAASFSAAQAPASTTELRPSITSD